MTYPFGGRTYEPRRDGKRLSKQFERVRDLMLDGEWRTLRDISDALAIPEASASARLRDLRKPEFGGYLVDREAGPTGLHHYRVREVKRTVPVIAPAPEPPGELGEVRLFDPSEVSKPLGAYDELDAA